MISSSIFLLCVVCCIFIMFSFFHKEIIESIEILSKDIVVHDHKDNNNPNGYNIGDLLNMPSFWHKDWKRNPHGYEMKHNMFISAPKLFPNSIVFYYSTLRTNPEEPIPDMHKIEQATDIYIKKNPACVEKIQGLLDDDDVLFVHLRSGDKGAVEDAFIDKINTISHSYKKTIIISGIHCETTVVFK